MKSFLDMLKTTYVVLGGVALIGASFGVPVWLAIHGSWWWICMELVTAPFGIATAVWFLDKTGV